MATLSEQEIEQIWLQIKEKTQEARDIYYQLMEAGAIPLDEDDLDQVNGGIPYNGGGGCGTNTGGTGGTNTGGTGGYNPGDFNSYMNWWFSNHGYDPTDQLGFY